MSRMSALKAFVKATPMELDVMISEVYRDLVDGQRGYAMVDGGAHKGWHTLRMLGLPGCNIVYAIEADPTVGDLLKTNLDKWHKDEMAKLKLIRKALQNDPYVETIPWMSSSSHIGRNSIQASNVDAPSIWTAHTGMEYRAPTTVPATTIDRILDGNTRPLPFIKLDLEGADILALQGAVETLRSLRPLVAFENAANGPQVHGYSLEDVAGFFAGLDYVALNYAGEPLTSETWFDFYEAWAVPREHLARVAGLIDTVIDQRLSA